MAEGNERRVRRQRARARRDLSLSFSRRLALPSAAIARLRQGGGVWSESERARERRYERGRTRTGRARRTGPSGARSNARGRPSVARTRSANRLSLSLCRQNSPRSRRRRSSGNNMAAADRLVRPPARQSLPRWLARSPPARSLRRFPLRPLPSPDHNWRPDLSSLTPLPGPALAAPSPHHEAPLRFALLPSGLPFPSPPPALTSGGVRFRSSRWIRFFMSMAAAAAARREGKAKRGAGPGGRPCERGAGGGSGRREARAGRERERWAPLGPPRLQFNRRMRPPLGLSRIDRASG